MVYLDGWTQRRQSFATDANIDQMFTAGSRGIRLTADFAFVAAGGNVGSPLTGLDTTMGGSLARAQHAASKGMGVLVCATYSPSWLSTYHRIPQTSGNQDAWAAVFARLVQLHDVHQGGPVTAWELWNEPNHDPFNTTPDMATIRPFMRKCILAARALVPNAFIMCGAPASAGSRSGQWTAKWDTGTAVAGSSISPATYLDGLYASGGIDAGTSGAWQSAMAIHGYTGAGVANSPSYNVFENPLWHAFRNMPNVGDPAVFGSNGFNYYDHILRTREPATSKVIWQTEGGTHGGWTTLTEGNAANHMTINLAMWQQNQAAGKAGPYIYFEWYDNRWSTGPTPSGPRTYEAGSGPEDLLGMYFKNPDGTFTQAKLQLAVWTAFTLYDPGVPDPPPPVVGVDVVGVDGPKGTPRGERARVPVRAYTARAYT